MLHMVSISQYLNNKNGFHKDKKYPTPKIILVRYKLDNYFSPFNLKVYSPKLKMFNHQSIVLSH